MNHYTLRYPNKSHRKAIAVPQESKDLAELIGIIFGDGGIGNNWQLIISLNSDLDKDYSIYIGTLIEKLFNIKPSIRKRPNQNTLVVVTSSINFLDYIISKGAIKGNKLKTGMKIPSWITKNPEFTRYFIRGLIDTDACMYIHKHKIKNISYINIGLCFTSASKELIYSVAEILNRLGIRPHIAKNEHNIYLYSIKSIVKYIDIFGSSNPRIYNKLKAWRDARVA